MGMEDWVGKSFARCFDLLILGFSSIFKILKKNDREYFFKLNLKVSQTLSDWMKLPLCENHLLLNASVNEILNPFKTVSQEDHHDLQNLLIDTIPLGTQYLLLDDHLQ